MQSKFQPIIIIIIIITFVINIIFNKVKAVNANQHKRLLSIYNPVLWKQQAYILDLQGGAYLIQNKVWEIFQFNVNLSSSLQIQIKVNLPRELT